MFKLMLNLLNACKMLPASNFCTLLGHIWQFLLLLLPAKYFEFDVPDLGYKILLGKFSAYILRNK